MEPLNLSDAHRLILATARPGKSEKLGIDYALGRIPIAPVKALMPVPHFNQALMDGFAVSSNDLKSAGSTKEIRLKIVGEIPAGCTDIPQLKKGEALHIMTGGAVPRVADLVLPQEDCKISETTLIVTSGEKIRSWIRRRGSELRLGRIIAGAGKKLAVEHLHLLAGAGISKIEVFKRPKVAVLSTGSELVMPGAMPKAGEVVSANPLQLKGLLQQSGCLMTDCRMAPDKTDEIAAFLDQQLAQKVDAVITTGGMGPGKYDLLPGVFKKLGINIQYRSLKINPGKNTMFGHRNATLFFALPGPPPAVRILFHELVQPALRKIMGYDQPLIKRQTAFLSEELRVRRPGFMSLLPGITTNVNGKITIRRGHHHEEADSIILIPPHRRMLKIGEKVTYHSF